MKARLWIREPSGATREVALDSLASDEELESEGVVLGRDSGADVALDDPAVSRFHAQITKKGDGWNVRDLGSRNKIFVNGDPVSDVPFRPGDQLVVGDSEIHLIGEVRRVESPSQTQVLSALTADGTPSRAAAALGTLHRLATGAVERTDSNLFLEQSLRILCQGLGADRGAVLTLDGDALLCRAAHSQQGQALQGFVLSQTIYRTILETREPLLSRNTTDDARFRARQSIVGEEIRSVLAAPIPIGGRLGGILYLDRLDRGDDGDEFQTEDLYAVAVAAEFLGATVDASSAVHALTGERDSLVKTIIETNPIIGSSPAIQRVRDFIARAAPTESTVLIQGETGTGKELVAQAIHYQSPRAGHPFVAINCAAIPETLIESELFGHEKGAFTGANARKIGKFEAAHGGTVFLDEIGELPIGCQSKLLRLLEERCFERVGGTQSVEVDVRIVAATNRDLAVEAEEGGFREDLFYRLNVLQVVVAPLSERREDIEVLIEHFLDHFSEKIRVRRKRFSDAARRKLLEHPWPGNVRQLRNTVESCVVMAAGEEIQLEDLPIMPAGRDRGGAAAWQPRSLSEIERDHIERVLDFCNWNKSKSAEILGIERSTLYARIRNYEIQPPEAR